MARLGVFVRCLRRRFLHRTSGHTDQPELDHRHRASARSAPSVTKGTATVQTGSRSVGTLSWHGRTSRAGDRPASAGVWRGHRRRVHRGRKRQPTRVLRNPRCARLVPRPAAVLDRHRSPSRATGNRRERRECTARPASSLPLLRTSRRYPPRSPPSAGDRPMQIKRTALSRRARTAHARQVGRRSRALPRPASVTSASAAGGAAVAPPDGVSP